LLRIRPLIYCPDMLPVRCLPAGPRHVTDREPEIGGQLNAEFIARRVSQAADRVGAHIVLGDQHILDAVAGHLPDSPGPITTIAGDRTPDGLDDHLGAALDEITAATVSAAGQLVAARAGGPGPAAVRGTEAVADQGRRDSAGL
jgi:hypothetical protein